MLNVLLIVLLNALFNVLFDVLFDDTKFGVAVAGGATRDHHIFAMHGGLIWQENGGPLNEQPVILAPRVMVDTRSSVMWACLNTSPVPWLLPDERVARFRATILMHDSVSANLSVVSQAVASTRREDTTETLVLSLPCKQHQCSLCLQAMSIFVGVVNSAFCVQRVLKPGSTFQEVIR